MERVIFIVDIEDPRAVRRMIQLSGGSSENSFFFLMPSNYWEYDPKKCVHLFDESITTSEELVERAPKAGEFLLSTKKHQKSKIVNYLNHDFYVVLFCRGPQAKTDLVNMVEELCAMYPHFEYYQNTNFDFKFL
jgi:hypothetical protein